MASLPQAPYDPRPATRAVDGRHVVAGISCPACGYVAAGTRPWCPECRGAVEEATFGPAGRVWSSTIVRVPVPGRTPPYAMAYVDIDEGPRVLAHLHGETDAPVPIGTAVMFVEASAEGDLVVEVAS